MSSAEEAEVGRRFDLEARAKLPVLHDVEIDSYIERMGQRIVAALDERRFDYQFTPLRDGAINAFAVPGGFVYVNAGLLVRASNDDEVAGVLGHEIAHAHARHLVRQQEKSQLLNYAAIAGLILGAIAPPVGAGALAVSTAKQLEYRREFEQEADFLGARYMKNAGYDPKGMLDFFQKLHQAQGPSDLVPPYLLSHPLTQERLTNLEAVLQQRQWDRGARSPASLELEQARLAARLALEPAPRVVADYHQRADAHRTDARARYLLGLALLQSGQADSARESFEQAAKLGFAAVDRELGRVALLQRRLPDAAEHLRRATERHDEDALAFRELGRTLEAQKDAAGAIAAYSRAVELAPRLEDAHYSLGLLLGRAGKQGEGFYHLGRAFYLRGDFEQSVSHFQKATAALPDGNAQKEEAKITMAMLSKLLGIRIP